MIRLAVLADVHGNLPALEAVLDDIALLGADEVVHAGDLVGRGPQGSAVVQAIRAAGIEGVRGNHEDFLLQVAAGTLLAGVPTSTADLVCQSCAHWMAAELDPDSLAFIADLPFDRRAASDAGVLVVHGSPRSNREGLGPWTDDASLRSALHGIRAAVVVCAHTHRPMVRRSGSTLVANTGSVGLPFDGDPRASYVVLEGRGEAWEAEIRRVDYDRGALLDHYRASGFWAAGGRMARALEHEIMTGRSHLVPFITWAEFGDRDPDDDAFDEFTAYYDPSWGLRGLRMRLGAEAAEAAPAPASR